MSGVKLGEYKSFLQFVKERTPELKNISIELNYGDEFSMTNILGEFFIDVEAGLTGDLHKFTSRYFADKINQNIYWMNAYYNEYFVLLHEIGHIITRNLITNSELHQGYQAIKNTTYKSHYEAFKAHRELVGEKLADKFAIDFTNKYFYEIGTYFTGMNETEINEFLGIV